MELISLYVYVWFEQASYFVLQRQTDGMILYQKSSCVLVELFMIFQLNDRSHQSMIG